MDPMIERKLWTYRGEGNSSLVITNRQERKVLRLRKRSPDSKTEKQEKNRRNLLLCKDYIDNVMRPLLGETFVASPELVKLSPEFISAVNRNCQLSAHADSTIFDALMLPDACILGQSVVDNPNPTYCVEIKCKQGFLPPYTKEKSKPHQPVCRFCMLQQLKVKKGTMNHLSKFCCLDIFSGNPDQMKHSIRMLIQTPQNNLKLFKDGSLIFPCHEGNPSTIPDIQNLLQQLKHLDDTEQPEAKTLDIYLQSNKISILVDVVVKALLHTPNKDEDKQDGHCVSDQCGASSFHQTSDQDGFSLPKGCVLNAILSAQHLDTRGVYEIHNDYERLTAFLQTHPKHKQYLTLNGPYPANYLSKVDQPDNPIQNHLYNSEIPLDVINSFTNVREYLVAGTSKDLSIMLTFRRVNDIKCHEHLTSSHGIQFEHSIQIVDLDPKPSTRIPKYFKLEDEIWDNYIFQKQ